MLFALAQAVVSRFSDDGVRRLGARVFARSTRALNAAVNDPRAAQAARLRAIVSENQATLRGKELGFAAVAADADVLDAYRRAVAFVDWDDVSPYVERMVAGEPAVLTAESPIYYATTSGTTGRRKLIPVTSSFVNECKVSNRLLYRTMLQAMPGIVRGKRLNLRSPKTEKLSPTAEAGSITVALGGGDGSDFDAVPAAVCGVADFDARYFLALRAALQARITVCSAINPSMLHLFAETLATHAEALAASLDSGVVDRGVDVDVAWRKDPAAARRVRDSAMEHGRARMRDAFPELRGLVTWKGGASSFWLERLRQSYGPLPTLDYGYAASEGCFGAPVDVDGPGGGAASLLLPHGHVVELLPIGSDGEPARESVWLHEAEAGASYAVVVTTSSGLYRYRMHDVVDVVGHVGRAPLVVFRHKLGTMCSITGEKLGEAHIARALSTLGYTGSGVCLAPAYRDTAAPGYVAAVADDVHVDAAAFDAALMRENEEYEAKRKSLRLAPLVVAPVPARAFARWRANKVSAGAPEAHVKLPTLSKDGRALVDLGVDDDAFLCRRAP